MANAPIGGPLETSRFSIATPKGQKWNKFGGNYLSVGPTAYVLAFDGSLPKDATERKKYLKIASDQAAAKYRLDGWTQIGSTKTTDGNPAWISSKWKDEDGDLATSETASYFGKRTAVVHALISEDGSYSDAMRVLRSFREK